MASSEKSKLPNLKICIDNDDSASDDDNLSLTEEPQIQIEQGELDKRITNPVSGDISAGDSPSPERAVDADEDDVQFNVYLNKLETKTVENTFSKPTRRYENKDGNFVTGIDLTRQETVEKLQERAKRFGIEYKPEQPVDLEEIYKSLGLKPEDLNHKDERGVRLDAVHLRGVGEMNTKDVFNYFQEFAAGACEWIDDESCNIIWLDKLTAARAMLKLSRSYEQVMVEYGIKIPGKPKGEKKRERMDSTSETKMDEDKQDDDKGKEDDGQEVERDEEKMEEDNDDLDLTEEKKPVEENGTVQNKPDEEEKMEDEGIEEGEITDSDSEPEVPSKNQNAFNRIPWPPGKWRLGVPYKDRTKQLFLRFATKADVKLPGAEKRSKYYQKYGNPNYGGRVGLLSRSMKQKLRSRRDDDFDTFGVPDSRVSMADRNQVSYEDDLFTDSIVPVEVEELDMYTTSQKTGKNTKKSKKVALSDDEEMHQSSEENDFPVIERVTAVDKDEERGTDSEVDEEELERLLGAKEKKPMMRMYADELEEKQKANRQRQMVGALTIVADAKKKVKSIRDARQLITGVDLRTALQERKMNRQQSPDTWKRSRSRSLSPNFERDMGGGMNFKIITPMHMTIENEVMSDNEEEKEVMSDNEEVKEMSPEPVKEVKRKKQLSSPIGLKSKMDEVEKPKDIRSRLSEKARDNTRTARSPNNVKSRLSKRVSPENESPVRFDDTRISRIRRSRSHDDLRSKFNRSRSPVYRNRRPVRRRSRTRSPVWRRYNRRRSPLRNRSPLRRSPIRRFNRSRSRSPINRRQARSNIRSRSPVNRRLNDRTRSARNIRSRLGRKSRSPTDTESESEDERVEPSRIKMTVDASSGSSSSSSSSDSSSDESSSSSDSSSSSSSSSSDSSSSSSDSESDSDASERSAIRNKKTQRKMDDIRAQNKFAPSRKEHTSRRDSKAKGPHRKARRPTRPNVN